MIKKYFSEIFVEISLGIAVILIALTLCSMALLSVLAYIGVI